MSKQVYAAMLTAIMFLAVSCGDDVKEMPQGQAETGAMPDVIEGSTDKLPVGHPTIKSNALDEIAQKGHPTMGSGKEVRVTDETKAKWKEVKVEVIDTEKDTTTSHTVKIGSSVKIGDEFSIMAETFLPDYTIFDDHIGTKSEEPSNPALMLRLNKGSETVSKGWIFRNFTDFDSFKNDRFKVRLKTP